MSTVESRRNDQRGKPSWKKDCKIFFEDVGLYCLGQVRVSFDRVYWSLQIHYSAVFDLYFPSVCDSRLSPSSQLFTSTSIGCGERTMSDPEHRVEKSVNNIAHTNSRQCDAQNCLVLTIYYIGCI